MGCGSSNEVEELDVNEDDKVIYFTNHSIKCLNGLKWMILSTLIESRPTSLWSKQEIRIKVNNQVGFQASISM